MGQGGESDVGYRFSWLAGAAALLLALTRLGRLLRPAADGPPWELALLAAAVLGGAITHTARSYRAGPVVTGVLNAAAFVLAASRIGAPATTRAGVLPTAETFSRLAGELGFAYDILRHGTAPVAPVAGLVVLAAGAFWGMGALLVWGLLTGRPLVALLPPLLFYLQLSVIDHPPSGAVWVAGVLVVTGAVLAAVAADQRSSGAGTLQRQEDRTRVPGSRPGLPVAFVCLLVVASVTLAAPASGLVPGSGTLNWRSASGLGGGFYGSIAYNPFVGIRQRLVSRSDAPAFVARVSGDVDPADLYWRLITLDSFNGESWYAEELGARLPAEGGWEDEAHTFFGPTTTVTQDVVVEDLRMEWLPAFYTPMQLTSDVPVVEQGFRVRFDGSLRFDGLTYRGLAYSVRSEVPVPDLRVLSATAPGALSPLFERAAAEGVLDLAPTDQEIDRRRLPELERFLELPTDLPVEIRSLARQVTLNTASDFERAVVLERWFREAGGFRYSADIDPGHSATALHDWLLDPESPNHRVGYCEQFATAMAVMARALRIPSRTVLGFAPGDPDGRGNVVVRDRHAHAWVELWMESQGWVRFDPTPRGDGVNRPTSAAFAFDPSRFQTESEGSSAVGESTVRDFGDTPRFRDPGGFVGPLLPLPGGPVAIDVSAMPLLVLLGLALAGLLPAYKVLRRRRRLARLMAGDVRAAWEEVVDRLTDLGRPVPEAATPAELAESTSMAMKPLAAVYARAVYGRDGSLDERALATATESLERTEALLRDQHPPLVRLAAWYRLRSLRS